MKEKKPIIRAMGEGRVPPAFSDPNHREYIFGINPNINKP